MNQFISFFVFSFHFRNLYIEIDMFPFKVFQSEGRWGIWDYQINSIRFEDSINLFNHLAYGDQRIITAHKCIDCWFVKNHFKRLVGVFHLPYVHDFVYHMLVFVIDSDFFHLFNAGYRNVIVDCVDVTGFIKIILNFTVSTSNVEYFGFFVIVQLLFNYRLILE